MIIKTVVNGEPFELIEENKAVRVEIERDSFIVHSARFEDILSGPVAVIAEADLED